MKKFIALFLCLFVLTSCGGRDIVVPDIVPENDSAQLPVEPVSPAKTEAEQKPRVESDTESKEETPPTTHQVSAEPAAQTVAITVLGLDDAVIYSANAEYKEGMTVLDILLQTAKEKNLAAVYTGSKSSAYVTSIGGLSEKQHGSSSGWVYTVNGETIMRPCGKCTLSPDDKVVWRYITEF